MFTAERPEAELEKESEEEDDDDNYDDDFEDDFEPYETSNEGDKDDKNQTDHSKVTSVQQTAIAPQAQN